MSSVTVDRLELIHRELQKVNLALTGGIQPEIANRHGAFRTRERIDKGSTFTDTVVDITGYNLVQISTDGDLSDVSYKVGQLDGSVWEDEASLCPHIVGFNQSLAVTNDTAEGGKYVYITKNRCPPILAAAIKHGSPGKTVTVGLSHDYNFGNLDPSERALRMLHYRDDMEAYTTMKFSPVAPVAAGEVTYINTVQAFEGDYVLCIDDADATADYATVRFGRFEDGIHGVEMRWWKDANIDLGGGITVTEYDGTNLHRFGVQYDEGNNVWQYIDSAAGAWTNITGGAEVILNDSWCYVKLLFDTANNRYHRLITDRLDRDLTGLAERAAADATEQSMLVQIGATVTATNPIYIDDFRVYKYDYYRDEDVELVYS